MQIRHDARPAAPEADAYRTNRSVPRGDDSWSVAPSEVATFSPPRRDKYCPSTGALAQAALVEATRPTESVWPTIVYDADARLQSARASSLPPSESRNVKTLGSAIVTAGEPVSTSDCRVHTAFVESADDPAAELGTDGALVE